MTTHPNTEQRKKLKRYDIPGSAHELPFSCYHRFHYLNDPTLFIDELSQARKHFICYWSIKETLFWIVRPENARKSHCGE